MQFSPPGFARSGQRPAANRPQIEEPPDFRHGPVWRYGDRRAAPEHALGPRHDDMRADLTRALEEILREAYDDDTSGT